MACAFKVSRKLFVALTIIIAATLHARVCDHTRIAINCGGTAISFGSWQSDSAYCTTLGSNSQHTIDDTLQRLEHAFAAPYEVYFSRRVAGGNGKIAYSFPDCQKGTYTVRLHDAQFRQGMASVDIVVEGRQVLENFSGFVAADKLNAAGIVEFVARVTDTNGLQIDFVNKGRRRAAGIAGVEVVPWIDGNPVPVDYGNSAVFTTKARKRQVTMAGRCVDKNDVSPDDACIAVLGDLAGTAELFSSPIAYPFGVVQATSVNDSGKFTLSLPPRVFPVILSVQAPGYAVGEIMLDSLPPDPVGVQLARLQTRIVRIAQGIDGKPLHGAFVKASFGDIGYARIDSTDVTGCAALINLEPGSYTLSIRSPGFLEYRDELVIGEEGPDTIGIVMDKGQSISGQVVAVGTEQTPIADATVYANVIRSGIRQKAVSDAKGQFTITGLPDTGSLVLSARKQGYNQQRRSRRGFEPIGLANLGVVTKEQTTVILEQASHLTVHFTNDESLDGRAVSINYTGRRGPRFRPGGGGNMIRNNTFVFKSISPGMHSFSMEVEGYQPTNDTSVTLKPGEGLDISVYVNKGLSLSGTVTSPSLQPIAGVNVTLGGSNARSPGFVMHSRRETYDARTDSSGRFKLEGLKAGTVRFSLEHEEYRTLDTSITLEEKKDGDNFKAKLQVGAGVAGKVVDEQQEPVARVRVALTRSGQVRNRIDNMVMTGRNGEYLFTGLAAGSYEVTILSEKYVAERKTVQLTAGLRLEREDFVLREGYAITGTVYQNNEGAKNITVIATPPELNEINANYSYARTDNDGNFELKGLTREKYDLRVATRQTARMPQVYATIEAPAANVVIELEKEKEFTISGNVKGVDGMAIEVFQVKAQSASRGLFYPHSRFLDFFHGAYTMKVPEVGAYKVVARAEGYAQYISKTITVSESRDQITHDITLSKGVTLKGVVISEASQPLANVAVTPEIESGAQTWNRDRTLTTKGTRTDRRGAFMIRNVNLDNTIVHFAKDRYLAKSIILDPDVQVSRMQVTLEKGGTVEGYVFDDAKQPVQGVRVAVTTHLNERAHHSKYRSETDNSGFYRIADVAAGPASITAIELDLWKSIEIRKGVTTTVNIEQPEYMGKITGTILFNNAPVESGEIKLSNPLQAANRTGEKRVEVADGSFIFEKVRRGSYQLAYRKADSRIFQRCALVSVGRDEVVSVEIKLTSAEISGRLVHKKNGHPMRNVIISLNDDKELHWISGGRSDMDGRFTINHVESGRYSLMFMMQGFIKKVMPVSVGPDESVDLGTIELYKGLDFFGTVTTAGSNVAQAGYCYLYDRTTGYFIDRFDISSGEFHSGYPLEEGDYLVTAGAEGFFMDNQFMRLDNEKASVTLNLEPCKPVFITVKDKHDNPVKNAYVYLSKKFNDMPVPVAQHASEMVLKTDALGRTEIRSYFKGNQKIVAGHMNYKDYVQEFDFSSGQERRLEIVLSH
ncbi:MAG: hypothetical protein GF398_07430 [Chitinivibrionales bacterium]|nr:hypothetical protein [Chitinivibrionales bacterium]